MTIDYKYHLKLTNHDNLFSEEIKKKTHYVE